MSSRADRQLALPVLDEPEPERAPDPPLPAPARACARCGWICRLDEKTCPLCHAPEDSS